MPLMGKHIDCGIYACVPYFFLVMGMHHAGLINSIETVQFLSFGITALIIGSDLNMAGAAIVTKLWFYIAAREREERTPVMFLMDEFQNFAGLETLGIMLAEGRKYEIQLVLAHQHLQQLKTQVSVNDVLGNTMTKVSFRVSGEDAAETDRLCESHHPQDSSKINSRKRQNQ